MKMKTGILSLAFIGSSIGFSIAQSEKLQGDSVHIEIEKITLAGELNQLRDSIRATIRVFDSSIKTTAESPKRSRILAGRKELVELHELVGLDLKEIAATGQNVWNDLAVNRIRLATISTRREYERVLVLFARENIRKD